LAARPRALYRAIGHSSTDRGGEPSAVGIVPGTADAIRQYQVSGQPYARVGLLASLLIRSPLTGSDARLASAMPAATANTTMIVTSRARGNENTLDCGLMAVFSPTLDRRDKSSCDLFLRSIVVGRQRRTPALPAASAANHRDVSLQAEATRLSRKTASGGALIVVVSVLPAGQAHEPRGPRTSGDGARHIRRLSRYAAICEPC
jgi:hypothetical protein